MAKREKRVISFRWDVRLIERLNEVSNNQEESRNFYTEQIVAHAVGGVPHWEWRPGHTDGQPEPMEGQK